MSIITKQVESNTFLPSDYIEPTTNSAGRYLTPSKLPDGKELKFRIMGSAVAGWEYWNLDNKPVRSSTPVTTRPEDGALNKQGEFKPKHFWAFPVYVYQDESIKIMVVTQKQIKETIEGLMKDVDWGMPTERGEPFNYDLKIIRTGEMLETKYAVTPVPSKTLNPDAAEKYIIAGVDLQKYMKGENPFNDHI